MTTASKDNINSQSTGRRKGVVFGFVINREEGERQYLLPETWKGAVGGSSNCAVCARGAGRQLKGFLGPGRIDDRAMVRKLFEN